MVLLTLPSTTDQILEIKAQLQHPVVLILLGPPGAGKGTQATILAKALETPHISTGNLLRSYVQSETSLGNKAKKYMDQGHLVPDSLILDMLFTRVAKQDCQKGYILDGFPRTLAQVTAYHKRLSTESKAIVLNLELSDDIIVERLSQRLICEKCNTPFHTQHSPPKKKGECDQCNGSLFQRSDDSEEVVRNRLTVYHKQTAPLIDYYSTHQSLKTISCNQPIEKVLEETLDYLKKTYQAMPSS